MSVNIAYKFKKNNKENVVLESPSSAGIGSFIQKQNEVRYYHLNKYFNKENKEPEDNENVSDDSEEAPKKQVVVPMENVL